MIDHMWKWPYSYKVYLADKSLHKRFHLDTNQNYILNTRICILHNRQDILVHIQNIPNSSHKFMEDNLLSKFLYIF
jgi:hypothetical protein